jgi:undecaprenyl-diphosphatase
VHSILKMIILGVVQGATEFLPVSSSGHLTIMQDVLGVKENRILFDVFLHVGTLIAILLVFGKHVIALFSSNRKWIPHLILATIPAAIIAFALRPQIQKAFDSTLLVGILLIGNSLILAAGSASGRRRKEDKDVGTKGALAVGLAQSLAILPGISRSGSTVCCGLLMGWNRGVAVRFSFLLAIPVMIGASLVEAMECRSAMASGDVMAMVFTGLVVAALVGYAALRLFLKAVEKGKLWIFAAYSLLLGVAVVVYELAT